jgi:TetR/AcrR family transcriptional regulator, repressor for uid operon
MSAIVAAARGCIAAYGFHAATTARIAAAAGISIANLFQYFETKDALIRGIALDDLKRDLELVRSLENVPDFFDAIEDAMYGFLSDAQALDDLRVRAEVFTEALRNPQLQATIAEGENEIEAELARIIGLAQKRGEVRTDQYPAAIASLILCIFDGICGRAGAGATHALSAASASIRLLRAGLSARSGETRDQ